MAIEDTYLWRGVRDELYSMFWIRLVKTAAKGGVTQGRYSIITDRPDYNKGPKVVVKVSATMLDDKIKSQKKIKAYYKMLVVSQDTKDEPEPQEVMITLEADTSAGNEGKFIGEIMTESLAPGYYTLWLDKTILANVEETVSTQFTIREVEPENLDRTAKSALLDIIAKITIPKPAGAKDADRKTQGFSLSRSLSDIYAIPDNFVAEKVHVRVATAHIPIWASWLTLLLALVLLSIEWIIRKLRRLI